jgi:DNA-binding transcriptional LysR family regulator
VNLRQLEYFVVIAEEGSLTRAAKRLLVAQPSLSQQVAALEAEVGGTLLERLPRGVRLTAAGERFLGEARAAVAHAEAARRAAREALGLEAGELHIATIPSVAVGVLTPALRRWLQLHPSVEIGLREYTHRRIMDEAMREGDGDVGVGMVPADWLGPVEALGWEEFVVVLPEGDPLLDRRAVPLEALAERRWVHFHGDHGLAEIVDLCLGAAGFAPRVAVRTSHVAPAPLFAAAGLGPTLVPETIVPESLRPFARVLRPRRARRLVAFVREWSPAARAFVDLLLEQPSRERPRGVVEIR